MSSPSSSSSGTGASRSPRASRRAFAWGAAALTAAALYALPPLGVAAAVGQRIATPLVVVALGVLIYAAVRIWSPLVVLGLVVLSSVGFVVWLSLVPSGGSALAWAGGAILAVAIVGSQLRRGGHVFWAVPAGWLAATAWFILVAQL